MIDRFAATRKLGALMVIAAITARLAFTRALVPIGDQVSS
jgi:hypothetical protein